MDIAITVVHVIACFFLIVVVLLQTGKGADIGAVFGGSSQTVFGSGGAANLLTRLTTYTAVIFMITSLMLTWMSTRSLTLSVADDVPFEPPPLAAPANDTGAPTTSDDSAAAAPNSLATSAEKPAAAPAESGAPEEPVAAEEPAPEKPAAAGAADTEEEKEQEAQREEAAEATAEDVGAALDAGGVGTVEQIEEQMKAEDEGKSGSAD